MLTVSHVPHVTATQLLLEHFCELVQPLSDVQQPDLVEQPWLLLHCSHVPHETLTHLLLEHFSHAPQSLLDVQQPLVLWQECPDA